MGHRILGEGGSKPLMNEAHEKIYSIYEQISSSAFQGAADPHPRLPTRAGNTLEMLEFRKGGNSTHLPSTELASNRWTRWSNVEHYKRLERSGGGEVGHKQIVRCKKVHQGAVSVVDPDNLSSGPRWGPMGTCRKGTHCTMRTL
ncbi:hypothetical protein BY996DRAFT_6411625 [Phakopsora pachyrhizi]|nr:hypothetical protein BY996DRAFT_6411625 [Phakopsora pachyrhizi]